MKDGKEELKDIESEIRARALAWLDEGMTRYDLRLADRIAEAREREMMGDAAMVRAALDLLLDTLEAVGFRPIVEGDPLAESVRIAREALAAPARQCDKYKTAEEAKEAYELQSGMKDYDLFAWWCFATFDKAEGGAQ